MLTIAEQLGAITTPSAEAGAVAPFSIAGQLAPVAGIALKAPDPIVHRQTFRMCDVLRVLADGTARSTVEIAEHLGATKDTTQKILRRLVVKDLVERAGTVAHTRIALWRKTNV